MTTKKVFGSSVALQNSPYHILNPLTFTVSALGGLIIKFYRHTRNLLAFKG
jgi:hypothetical protein